MFLLPNCIRLLEPSRNIFVDFVRRRQSKVMHVIARRKRFDFSKARMFEPARQNNMTIDPFGTSGQLGKRHSNLKSNARFFGQNRDRTAAPDCLENRFVDFVDLLGLAFEMMFQIVDSAEVRLVPIREFAFALRAFPQGPFRAPLHYRFSPRSR
jgi:hypothetical protein